MCCTSRNAVFRRQIARSASAMSASRVVADPGLQGKVLTMIVINEETGCGRKRSWPVSGAHQHLTMNSREAGSSVSGPRFELDIPRMPQQLPIEPAW